MSKAPRRQSSPYLLWGGAGFYILAFLLYPLLPAVRTSTEFFLWWSALHSVLGIVLAYVYRNAQYSPVLLALLFFAPRLISLPMLPWLSDDVFRYLWDARLLVHGYNPYVHLPESPELVHLRGSLFDLVDYTHISTLYPPLAQLLFGAAVVVGSLFTDSWQGGYFVWKLLLIAAEALGVYAAFRALRLLTIPVSRLALYLFLPLPVVECAGQAHIDGLLAAPIGGLMYLCAVMFRTGDEASAAVVKKRSLYAGTLAAVFFLLKIMPAAAVLPLLRTRLRWEIFFGVAAVLVFVPSVPFFIHPEALPQFLSVVRFYSHVSQFNGVVLYTLMHVLEYLHIREWWLVAPSLLSLLRAAAVLVCGLFARPRTAPDILRYALVVLTSATLLSGKVHIWYFVPLLLLNCAVGWWWLPLFASASVLTYAIYAGPEWKEAYTLEYVLWAGAFFVLLAEILWQKRVRSQHRIT